MSDNYDILKIENQLCFPLYACAKEVIKLYKPLLDPLDLTYTQYITMMVIWERKQITVKELGKILYLDSGTLTPVLKKMELKGFIIRERAKEDERNLNVKITACGDELKKQAADIPAKLGQCVNLSQNEATTLYQLLYKILGSIDDKQNI